MKKILYSFFLIVSPILLIAQDECIPDAPQPPRLVNDYAGLIDDALEKQMESDLVSFNDTTSTQITVVTLSDLCGYDPALFATRLGENWGVGNQNFDNGIVVLVKPKTSGQRGQAFIAVGYGLEGVLPDAIAKRIVSMEMIPAFKKGDYNLGISSAVSVIMDITAGEYSAENYQNKMQRKTSFLPFLFVLAVALFMFFGLFRRARSYAHRNDIGFWAALWLMGSMSGRHRGHYNNFSSGGGGFGGFGGGSGGFGGFGGGSFGGGGAGGSW